jgi:hypothetical protein
MIARKLTCLFLAVVFALAMVVPATAGDTPPPGSDDKNVHPWDNNDGFGARGGPLEVYSRPIIIFAFGYSRPAVMLFSKSGSRISPEPWTITRTPERTPLRVAATRNARR